MKHIIYSVEDDENIRELINYTLSRENYDVRSFENGEDCLKNITSDHPALILLDIMLPGIDGITLLKQIRSEYSCLNIKIIMLTAKSGEVNMLNGLNAGADDYIVKPFSVLELVARVSAHLRGRTLKTNDSLEFSKIKIYPKSRDAEVAGAKVKLTYIEFELLKVLLENKEEVVTRDKMLNEIWGTDYYGESRTIDIHIKNLRSKLGIHGDNIVSIRGIGYMIKADQK
ncbi:MAG: response regulator transcription factor [Christensenellaceae bacterium]|nr:response regulator transcription factor [Christensenellaceae bacterium]